MGDRLRGRRARAHRDADVGELERQCVIDPVAGHGDGVSARLQGGDHRLLLPGRDAAEHGVFFDHGTDGVGVVGHLAGVYRLVGER